MAAPCDVECQRNKKLKTLLGAYQEATVHKGTDPEGFEKAKVAYFTVKEGQSWLHKERESIAKKTIQPILDSYTAKYNQAVKAHTATNDQKNSEVGDEDEARFITREINKERNKAGVVQRLTELSSDDPVSWIPYLLDILVGLLSLVVVYFAIVKFSAVKSYLMPSTSVIL